MIPKLKVLQTMQTAGAPWKKRKLLMSSKGVQNAMEDVSHTYF